MANTGKPKNVKMAKAVAPKMKMPTKPTTSSRASKAHPWSTADLAVKINTGGKNC